MAALTEHQSEHQRLKMGWDQTWGPTNRPFRHDKTSVLQLYWKEPHDDLKVGPEVERLGKVFEDVYGFKVKRSQLDVHKAQQQALSDLSKFVLDEDDERALLIIYYAGHGHGGNAKPGDMCLDGKTNPKAPLEKRTGIIWSKAEPAIRETLGDVLLIFDCCDAGRLAIPYTRGEPTSYFQILGACSEDQTTPGPGDHSFTTALIWALKEFAKKASPFSTAELRAKIKDYADFPKEQIPALSGRREPFENITISAKGSRHEDSDLMPSTSEREEQMDRCEHIDLRFHFKHKVDDEHIDRTADGLKKLLDRGQPEWTRVSFLGKSSVQESESPSVHRIATRLIEVARRRKTITAAPTGNGHCPPPMLTESPPSESPATTNGACQPPSLLVPPTSSPKHSGEDNEDAESRYSGCTETGHHRQHDSIAFHLRAIARNLQSQLSAFLSRIARWLMPRSDYERIPDEPV